MHFMLNIEKQNFCDTAHQTKNKTSLNKCIVKGKVFFVVDDLYIREGKKGFSL